jgi:hypothetical protein
VEYKRLDKHPQTKNGMKKNLLILFVLISLTAFAQKEVVPTDEIVVTGLVEKEMKLSLSDINAYTIHNIGDVEITNHAGEKRGTAKALKGILLKDFLSKAEFKAESPKVLSEFILLFLASDGYKVVYSWNEIFNSPTGDHLYLVTEKEGVNISSSKERMLLITPSDFKTGRRYIKGLSKIVVKRVD